ncbi:hypothetical protein GCM10009868_18270 [Terrabacter aerolatus]|uniref:D-inositol 3-phosphate glycosyltransferase n=1 Tax=Terrabacter aerolatus TaxID=422442 RepID=A0A512CZP9_9MICO|nr:hypothetical protein TAE01_15080 [Terrabacter aerolatus]
MLTGFPNYPTGQVSEGYRVRRHTTERVDGVDVHRVALYASHDASTLKRMMNYGSFGVSAMVSGGAALRGLDALWVNYSPITVAGAQLVARHAFGVPSVVHVLDLWPDTLFAGGFASEGRAGRVLAAGLERWCRSMYGSASSVAYISPSVGETLEGRGVPRHKLHYVPMWADEGIFRPGGTSMRKTFGIDDDAIVLLYAGAMGEAQGLESLIEACRQISDPRFVCLMAGSGVTEAALRAQAEGLSNVRFIGRVTQDEMTDLMATADVNFVGLRSHALSHLTMPSKTQATLAAGKPLIVAAEGDVAGVVSASGAGFLARPGDVGSIAAAILAALGLGRPGLAPLGDRARAFYDSTFSVREGVARVEALLTDAAESGPRVSAGNLIHSTTQR